MKSYILLLLYCTLLVPQFSCKKNDNFNDSLNTPVKKKRIIKEKYSISLNYSDWKNEQLKGDFVHLFFESIFDGDSVCVFSNGEKKFNDVLTTDKILGLAKEIEIGKLSEINEISFRINNGRDIIIRDLDYNFLFIGYFKDSLVEVDLQNKFWGYK